LLLQPNRIAGVLASPTGFELETIKSEGDGEESEVFDIWRLKKMGH
jgi:hypothetical protein